MSRTHLLIQKKLHDLESEVTHLSNHPPETSIPDPIADGFRHRLVFLRNLLTAELAVHPFKPNHLVQIKEQLDELETIYRLHCTHMNASDGVHGDDDLVCSCMESSLNNDGGESEGMVDEEGLGVYEDIPERFNNIIEAVVPLTEPEKGFGYHDILQSDDDRKENNDGGSIGGGWRMGNFRVIAIWILLCAILMVNFSKVFYIF